MPEGFLHWAPKLHNISSQHRMQWRTDSSW